MIRSEEGLGWKMFHARNEDVFATMADDSVDVIITDPPYSEQVHSRSIRRTYLPDIAGQPCRRMRAHAFGFDHITPEDIANCSAAFRRLAKRWTLVFSDMETAHDWRTGLTATGLDFVRYWVWTKGRGMPQISGDRPASWVEQVTIVHRKGRKRWNGGGRGNYSSHPVVANCNGHRTDRIHTAQKPLALMTELVELFSDPGDVVFDPFGGSATTGVACLRLGRRFIGVEQCPRADHPEDKDYFQLSCDRLRAEENVSTLQASRDGQGALFGGDR